MLEQVKERQQACLEGKAHRMAIFPEGGTTNGLGLLQFKKGAFASLLPVQPYLFKYKSGRCSVAHGDGTNAIIWIIMLLQTMWFTVEMTEMPVFEPNEYFWEHHLQPGEEKWQAYARVVRDIMADQGGLEKFDSTVEDKLEYKTLFKGKKPRPAKVDVEKTPDDKDVKPVSESKLELNEKKKSDDVADQ